MQQIDKRRLELLCKIAKEIEFEVAIPSKSGYYYIKDIKNLPKWIENTYSKSLENYQSVLEKDLIYLKREDFISFSSSISNQTDEYGSVIPEPNHLKWNVGLTQKGCYKAKEESESLLYKAYKKQPVTFIIAIGSILIWIIKCLFKDMPLTFI